MMYPQNLPGIPALFDLEKTEHGALFADIEWPWEVLPKIAPYLAALLSSAYPPELHSPLPASSYAGPDVWLGPGCRVDPGVYIEGPAWIGPGCTLRHGLYVRENVIAGAGSILGHCCELKNSLIFQEAQIPHFNYVGDCVFGYRAHIGAGVIVSNVRLDKRTVRVKLPDGWHDTGMEKFGALVGDGCETGCNSVLNPGSILGRGSVVLPLSPFRGILPEAGCFPPRCP